MAETGVATVSTMLETSMTSSRCVSSISNRWTLLR